MRLLKYLIIFLLYGYSATQMAFAQKYNFKNITVKEGLASSFIINIFQDSKGFIWVGTQGGGVDKFDGKNCINNYSKKNGLISNSITFITEDKKGNIIISTEEGVSVINGTKLVNIGTDDVFGNKGVYWTHVDSNNFYWFAVRELGVVKYDGKTFKTFNQKQGLPSEDIYTIIQDKKGNYWFAGSKGIVTFDGEKIISQYPFDNQIFFSSLIDSDGNIWFGSTTGLIVMYDGKKFNTIELPNQVQNDFIGSIKQDKKGNIWIATNHGVLKYDNGEIKLFTDKKGLTSNLINSLEVDYEDNLWIATHGAGINLFNNESYFLFSNKGDNSNIIINCVMPLDKTFFIAGTQSTGLIIYDEKIGAIQFLKYLDELSNQTIYSIVIGNDNNIYVGAEKGIYILKKESEKFKIIQKIESYNNERIMHVQKIMIDKKGNIWCPSYGSGLFKISDGKIENFSKENYLPSNDIFVLYEDSKSNIWIGTQKNGVVKYDGKKFTHINEYLPLKNQSILAIAEDDNKNIFFATDENGIIIYQNDKFKEVTTADGLLSNNVTSLLYEPEENVIWAGTNKGINKLLFNKQLAIENIDIVSEKDGLKGFEINGIVKDNYGYIWIISDYGLCRYDRRFDIPNLTPPKLYLKGMRLGYKNVDWKQMGYDINSITNLPENLNLSYKNNNLTFDFQALTIDDVKYSFMLEGQDEAWSPLTINTEAQFSYIEPGKKYTFKLKAVNSNGVWSKDIIEYTFEIAPPWWKTWWFYVLAVVVILVTVFGIVNYRTAQLAKEKVELETKVEERTVELKDANNKLSLAFQDIKDSINYAQKIQSAILPIDEEIQQALPDSFVFYKPRDVVSGDFYWFNNKNGLIYMAAVDCTGHGVPGAFMSMIGSSLLNEILNKNDNLDAASILKNLDLEVRKSLKQDRDSVESKDGMDLALTIIDKKNNVVQYSGAKRSLVYVRNNEVIEVKADKQSIGGGRSYDETVKEFTNHLIQLEAGDSFYLFTDGYVDQFGGEKGKKFSSKKLKETILSLQNHSMEKQGAELYRLFEDWRYGIEQVDDVLVIGFKL